MRTVLIANRAEIAHRILRSCHALGLGTVAVFSDADADLPYVRAADKAVRIGPGPASSSYLQIDRLLDAARSTGADAVHPGYGFLSENADFAQAVIDAGLTWIGPPPEAIRVMGDKAAARKLADAQKVPTVPGYDGDLQDDKTFAKQAKKIGFPLLVKAAAGGGGRGMREVLSDIHLTEALASARREAQAAFGNARLLLERRVQSPRHVEVQILADAHGKVLHLYERDCSVQRRHQKVIEEAPSPGVSSTLREQLGGAAKRLAQAVGYVGAGTVEFLVEGDHFYFLEMNTRLQVEHPVTEAITGLDLVAEQLRVAQGLPLAFEQADVHAKGHAIEARLYAEDPLRDYLPGSGPLVRFEVEGVRVDAGYEAGNTVGIHYDAMLAKLIAWAPTRAEATRQLARAVQHAWVPGVTTNLPLLRQVLTSKPWLDNDVHTEFLEENRPARPPLNLERGALAATVLAWHRRDRPWPTLHGWRVEGSAWSEDTWRTGVEEVTLAWRTVSKDTIEVRIDDWTHVVRVVRAQGDALTVEVDDELTTWRLCTRSGGYTVEDGETVYVHLGGGEAMVQLSPRFPPPKGLEAPAGSCVAPTPGTVVAIYVKLGDTVSAGERLATLEAMKMEHLLTAPNAGTVTEIRVQAGDSVDQGTILLRVEDASDDEG